MRLRELKFPIAILGPNILMGGKASGLSKPARFNFNIAEYYLDGGYSDTTIYDADGGKYSVDKIEFTKPSLWYYFGERAGNFFIFLTKTKLIWSE